MTEDVVRAFGYLCLGSRFRRIGERLQAETQKIIDESGARIQAAQYPLLAAIDRAGSMTIGELAEGVGISQPGITRTLAQLAEQGLVQSSSSSKDQRRRIVVLTPAGKELVERSKRDIWPLIAAAVADLCDPLSGPLLDQLGAIEDGLDAAPLQKRVEAILEVAP